MRTARGRAFDALVLRVGEELLTIAFEAGVDPKLRIGDVVEWTATNPMAKVRSAVGAVASTFLADGRNHVVVSREGADATNAALPRRPSRAPTASLPRPKPVVERPRARVVAGGDVYRGDVRQLTIEALTLYVAGPPSNAMPLGAAIKVTLELPRLAGQHHFWAHIHAREVLSQGTLYRVRFDLSVPGAAHQQELLRDWLDGRLHARHRATGPGSGA